MTPTTAKGEEVESSNSQLPSEEVKSSSSPSDKVEETSSQPPTEKVEESSSQPPSDQVEESNGHSPTEKVESSKSSQPPSKIVKESSSELPKIELDVSVFESTKSIRPPVETVEFETKSDDSPRRLLPFRDVSPKSVVFYAVLMFIGQLVIASCLHKAGMTDTDLLEEFIARSMLQNGWARINGSISMAYMTQEESRPGFQLAKKGARAKYPIVMVPGFVTSGLELWGGEDCARKHFRQRLWGALGTARTFFTDRDCFLRHLALDPLTGGDPKNIRLRAAQGFEAADYFMSAYWVWEKLINNLADVGYDPSNMVMMSYDWRIAFPVLEERDGYLTKLRYNIEAMHKTNGKKVVLATHSMGTLVTHYFLAWVTTEEYKGGGGGGPEWVEEHIHAVIHIAGPTLGVPKAVPALLSGEFKDTSALLGTIGNMVEHFFGRRRRKDLWTTWGSLWTMLPKGGNAIWGSGADICNSTSVVEGLRCRPANEKAVKSNRKGDVINAPFLEMTAPANKTDSDAPVSNEGTCKNLEWDAHGNCVSKSVRKKVFSFLSRSAKSTEDTIDFLINWGGGFGPALSAARLHPSSNDKTPSKKTWHDPTVTPLPNAPSLKIYCLYGVGLETERAYFYKRGGGDESSSQQCSTVNMDLPFILDSSVQDPEQDIQYGVRFVDGDGSVPLLSSGYMCVDGWARKDSWLNPSGSQIITREYKHNPEFQVDDPMRGGPGSTEHVDILGNTNMMHDFLRVVTDFEPVKENQIVSDIEDIARRVNEAHPHGGLAPPEKKLWHIF